LADWALQLKGAGGGIVAIISIAACALLAVVVGPNTLKIDDSAPSGTAQATAGADWQAWAPGRVEAELAAGKPVFVDFTAAWCITCQVNKKTTLTNAEVQQRFAAKGVTLLRADWTRRDPAITVALQALGRSGVPVYVLHQAGKPPLVFSEILSATTLNAALDTL
jgi:thiol:disulfide interchange protein DsbD